MQVEEACQDKDKLLTVRVGCHEQGGSNESITSVDCLLWAIGRDVNVAGLALTKAVSNCMNQSLEHEGAQMIFLTFLPIS